MHCLSPDLIVAVLAYVTLWCKAITSGNQTTDVSAMGTQNNTDIIGSCIALKPAGAGIKSTTINIDRFTRMNTPNFYMRQNVALFLDKWFFIQ